MNAPKVVGLSWLFITFALYHLTGFAADSVPPTTGILPSIFRSDAAEIAHLKQSPELAESLARLQQGTVKERIQALIEKTRRDMIFVEGGSFLMGDFGEQHNEDGLPWSSQADNKPLHKVELDSFSLGKYKVTYAEYDVYTQANKLPKIAMTDEYERESRIPNGPAGVKWQGAKNYCGWIGRLTGLPFDLPTEAQWEYAARSRGQFIVFPTDNGIIEEGRNVPSFEQLGSFPPEDSYAAPYPIGMFPATPLGFYDLAHNGNEWMNDWYAADYYSQSPIKNPKGPKNGKKKVLRSWPNGDGWLAVSLYRRNKIPEKKVDLIGGEKLTASHLTTSFRCALHQPTPVK